MGEDPLDDGEVIDRGHQRHPPGTARTAEDIQAEGAKSLGGIVQLRGHPPLSEFLHI